MAATRRFSKLSYDLIGRGDLLLSRKLELQNAQDKLSFRILLPPNASPQATLLVYVIHDGEVVADSVHFKVSGFLNNYLNVTMSKTDAEPGDEVDIVVSSRPNSLVGLRGIDQSVLLLKEDKDIDSKSLEVELMSWSSGNTGMIESAADFIPTFNPLGSTTASKVFKVSLVSVGIFYCLYG